MTRATYHVWRSYIPAGITGGACVGHPLRG